MSIKNLLAWGTSVPLALASLVSLSNSANAALLPFSRGDRLNFTAILQVNGSVRGLSVPPLYDLDTRYGIEGIEGDLDQSFDFLFANPAFINLTQNNRIIDNVDPQCPLLTLGGTQGCTQDADPGERGILQVVPNNTGVFSDIAPFTQGTIRSFDSSPTFSGTYLPNTFQYPFVSISDSRGVVFDFTLDSFDSFVTPELGGLLSVSFTGLGRVRQYDPVTSLLSEANYLLYMTAILNDSGAGEEPVAGDNITSLSSASLSFIVTSSVPEPNGIIGTAVAVGLGLLTHKKKWV